MSPMFPATSLQTSFGVDATVASGYYIYFTCTASSGKKFRLLNATGWNLLYSQVAKRYFTYYLPMIRQRIKFSYVGTWLLPPPFTPDFLAEVGLNLALGLVTSCCSCQTHDRDLHSISWGEGPWALVTPVEAIRVGVGIYNKEYNFFNNT